MLADRGFLSAGIEIKSFTSAAKAFWNGIYDGTDKSVPFPKPTMKRERATGCWLLAAR